jgi:hypothetical protein
MPFRHVARSRTSYLVERLINFSTIRSRRMANGNMLVGGKGMVCGQMENSGFAEGERLHLHPYSISECQQNNMIKSELLHAQQ